MVAALKTFLRRIDAKIVSSLSLEAKKDVSVETKHLDFTTAKTKTSLLEMINTYDREVLPSISQKETRGVLNFLLPVYIKMKKVVKPRLKTAVKLVRKIKAKIL